MHKFLTHLFFAAAAAAAEHAPFRFRFTRRVLARWSWAVNRTHVHDRHYRKDIIAVVNVRGARYFETPNYVVLSRKPAGLLLVCLLRSIELPATRPVRTREMIVLAVLQYIFLNAAK